MYTDVYLCMWDIYTCTPICNCWNVFIVCSKKVAIFLGSLLKAKTTGKLIACENGAGGGGGGFLTQKRKKDGVVLKFLHNTL